MTTELKLRRGTSGEMGSFTGAEGEPAVDTTNKRIIIHDGATAGGHAAAKLSEVLKKADLVAKGDLISASAAGTPAILTAGANGEILSANDAQASGLEWIAAPSGGSGKAVLWLLPQDAILPNTLFGRPSKVAGTNFVYNAISFLADGVNDANDEAAYWQIAMPTFYAGGALSVKVYSLSNSTDSSYVAKFYLLATKLSDDATFDAAGAACCNFDLVPASATTKISIDGAGGNWSANLPTGGQLVMFKVYVDHSASSASRSAPKDAIILAIKIEED